MTFSFSRLASTYIFSLILFLIGCVSLSPEESTNDVKEYKVQRDSVWIQTSTGKIFGIVFKPIGLDGQLPAILCLQGGGDVGLANYIYEAEFFAKNGVVALVCDKSGTGLSKTTKDWTQQSFEDKTQEYYELFSWLSNQPEVSADKVGLHGMSEGGRLALNLALAYPDNISFVNSVSGPIESFKKNQIYAIRHYLLARSIDTVYIEKAISIWDTYFDEISVGEISQITIDRVIEIRSLETGINYLPRNSTELPNRPLPQDIHFSQENKIKSIRCPVLFQFGELDILVDPKRSISLIPTDPKFTVKLYGNTDHSMNLTNGDIHPDFLADKMKWLNNIL